MVGGSRCLLGEGLCSHPTSELPWLLHHVFLQLWGLTQECQIKPPCHCGVCDGFLGEPGAVLGPRCPSASAAQLYFCIPGARTGTETTTSTSHGTGREEGFPALLQPQGGLGSYRDPQLTAGPFFCILRPHSPAEQRALCLHLQHLPWGSSYSNSAAPRATQQCLGSLSSSSQECEQPDKLLESSLLAPQMTSSP